MSFGIVDKQFSDTVELLRQAVKADHEQWQLVPYLAAQALSVRGGDIRFTTAMEHGVWSVGYNPRKSVLIECNSGELYFTNTLTRPSMTDVMSAYASAPTMFSAEAVHEVLRIQSFSPLRTHVTYATSLTTYAKMFDLSVQHTRPATSWK